MATDGLVALYSTTLAADASTISISGIPQNGYRDLRIVIAANVASGAGEVLYWRLNNDATAKYTMIEMDGNGSTASAVSSADQTIQWIGRFYSTPTVVTIDLMDYKAVDKHKVALSRTSGAANVVEALAARWASTSAVTSITFTTSGANFAANSKVSIYGIAG